MKFFAELEKLNVASREESSETRSIVKEIVTTYHPTDNKEDRTKEHMEALKRAAEKINED